MKNVKTIIQGTLQLETVVISDLEQAPSGITHRSYFVTVNDEKFIVRFAGLNREIWQYFSILSNIRSVSVRDDMITQAVFVQ